jgi:hypothetical protein
VNSAESEHKSIKIVPVIEDHSEGVDVGSQVAN